MYTIWKLTIASLKMFVRNKQALFFTFFTPLLIMVIFGAIGFDRAQKIDIGIALQGGVNQPTRGFLEQVKNISLFNLSYGSLENERKALEAGDRSIVIVLTSNPFTSGQNVSSQNTGTLTILRNAGDTEAITAVGIISQMLDKQAIFLAKTPQLVHLNIEEVNVHNLRYMDFLLPGLVALSVMQLAVFSVAFVFVDFKEKGILKRVIATPIRPYQFVTANIITRLFIAVIQALFFILLGTLFFKVTVVGSYWLIVLLVILGATMFLSLGFIISGISKTTESVPALANLIVFPMLFLGGTFFAIDAMPIWLQYVSKALPLTYFSTALRDVMTKGAGLADISFNVAIMIAWSVVLTTLAIYIFRLDEKRGM